jgi:hypothetical protein
VRSTLMFNVELDERAELAAFYPNVLSGLLSWAGLDAVYPILAVAIMVVAVLAGRGLRLPVAMLLATTVFLLASPTPEPQYLPVVLLLFLGALADAGRATPGRSPGDESGDHVPEARLERGRVPAG